MESNTRQPGFEPKKLSANQAYKRFLNANGLSEGESGAPTFKDWLNAEQLKGNFVKAKDKVTAALDLNAATGQSLQPWRPLGMHPLAATLFVFAVGTLAFNAVKLIASKATN